MAFGVRIDVSNVEMNLPYIESHAIGERFPIRIPQVASVVMTVICTFVSVESEEDTVRDSGEFMRGLRNFMHLNGWYLTEQIWGSNLVGDSLVGTGEYRFEKNFAETKGIHDYTEQMVHFLTNKCWRENG